MHAMLVPNGNNGYKWVKDKNKQVLYFLQEEEGESTYHVCLAFFDTTYNQFFGRKWCGSSLPAKFDKNGKAKIQFNEVSSLNCRPVGCYAKQRE